MNLKVKVILIDDLEKLLIFMYTSDIIGSERIVSSDFHVMKSSFKKVFICIFKSLYFQFIPRRIMLNNSTVSNNVCIVPPAFRSSQKLGNLGNLGNH